MKNINKQKLKKSKIANIANQWAKYSMCLQNKKVNRLQYVIAEAQTIFTIIEIYYNIINQNANDDMFYNFIHSLSWILTNPGMLTSNTTTINNNQKGFYDQDILTWIFFILSNVFVYSILLLAIILYFKHNIFGTYTASIYRYLEWCRSWHCNVLYFIIHRISVSQLQKITMSDGILDTMEYLVFGFSAFLCIYNLFLSLVLSRYMTFTLEDENYYNINLYVCINLIFKFGIVFIPLITHPLFQLYFFLSWIIYFILHRTWIFFQIISYSSLIYSMIIAISLGIQLCEWINILLYVIIIDKRIIEVSNIELYFSIVLTSCSPFICLVFYSVYMWRYNKVIFVSEPKIETQIIAKYMSLKEYLDKGYQSDYTHRQIYEYELIIQGELKNHQEICKNCTHKEAIQGYIADPSKRKVYFNDLRLHYLEKILARGLEKYSRSFDLLKYLVILNIDNRRDIIKAMVYLQKLRGFCGKFDQFAVLEYLNLKIKNFHDLAKLNESGLNLERLIQCEDFHDAFVESLKKHARSNNAFWKIFQESPMSITAILEQAEVIHKEFDAIQKTWKQYESDLMKYYFKPLYAYSRFLILLKNQEVLGETLLEKYHKLKLSIKEVDKEEKYSDENLYSERNAIITVSSSKERLGEIISCTSNIHDILGYESSALYKKNVCAILPEAYKTLHNYFIDIFLRTGIHHIINSSVIRYALHSDNYLVPIYLHIQLLIGINLEISFIGLIRPCPSADQAIILTNDGAINAVTDDLKHFLGLPLHTTSTTTSSATTIKKIYIHDICPSLKFERKSDKNTGTIASSLWNTAEHVLRNDHIRFRTIARTKIDYSQKFKSLKSSHKFINLDTRVLVFYKYNPNTSSPPSPKAMPNSNRKGYNFEVSFKIESDYINETCYVLTLKHISSLDTEKDYHLSMSNSLDDKLLDQIKPHSKTHINKDRLSSGENFQTERERNKMSIIDLKSMKPTILDLDNSGGGRGCGGDCDGISPNMRKFGRKIGDIGDSYIPSYHFNRVILANNDNPKNGIFSPAKSTNNPLKRYARRSALVVHPSQFFQKDLEKNLNVEVNASANHDGNNNNNNTELNRDQNLYETSSCFGKKSATKRFMTKIYAALEIPYEPQLLRRKLLLILTYFMVSLIILIVTQHNLVYSITSIIQDINVISTCNNRLTNYLELNRRAVMIYATYTGALKNDRWTSIGINNFFNFLIVQIGKSSQYMLTNNTLMRMSLPSISEEFQLDFYNNKVNIYDYYPNGTKTDQYITLNLLGGIQQFNLKTQLLILDNMNGNVGDKFLGNLFFITRNCLNDFLIAIEKAPNFLLEHMLKITLDFINWNVYILISIGISEMFIIVITVLTLILVYKESILILENLLRISKVDIALEISKANQFMVSLTAPTHLEIVKPNLGLKSKKSIAKPSSKSLSSSSTRNINYLSDKFSYKLTFFKYGIIIALSLGGVLFIFANFLRIYSNFDNDNKQLTTRLMSTNNLFHQQSLILTLIYEYINENMTTLAKNQPIDFIVEDLIMKISDISSFLNNFQVENGDFGSNYEYILKGNICLLYESQSTIKSGSSSSSASGTSGSGISSSTEKVVKKNISVKECEQLAGGIITQGLITLNSYLFEIIMDITSDYNASNKTKQAQIEMLNKTRFKNFELLYYYGSVTGYLYLNDIITNEIFESSKEYIEDIKTISIISSIGIGLGFIVIWYPMQRSIRKEANKVKRVMQVYPKAFLLNNPLIKRFIFKSSNGLLHMIGKG